MYRSCAVKKPTDSQRILCMLPLRHIGNHNIQESLIIVLKGSDPAGNKTPCPVFPDSQKGTSERILSVDEHD